MNRRLRIVAAGLALGWQAAVLGAMPLADWRREAAALRELAENDVPAAHERVQRLQAELPADAVPADRARAVNLLARIETHRGDTEAAADSADRALVIARAGGDKVGEPEAQLVWAIIAVDQGRIDRLVEAATQAASLLDGAQRPERLSEALLRLGTMHGRLGQLDDQVAVAGQALEMAARDRSPPALVYAHQGMAIAFDMTGRTDDAARHYELSRPRSAWPSRRSSPSARSVRRLPTTSPTTAWRTCTASAASIRSRWSCSTRSSAPTARAPTASPNGSR